MFPTWMYPFAILEPQDGEISDFYVVQKPRTTDFQAPEGWKGLSGKSL